jgi:hypothetical protein
MHTEDDADDQLIAEDLQMQVVTRAQKQAAERARDNALIPADGKGEQQTAPSKRQQPTKEKKVNSPSILLSEMHELDLARDFVRYKYPVTLPKHYTPPDLPSPKGDMVVVAMKAQRETKDKAVVWVEFLSPPSHVGRQIQLYPRSLERKRGLAQGADFSLLTAIRTQHPSANTWADLGVHVPSASSGTAAALAALADTQVVRVLRQMHNPQVPWKRRSKALCLCTLWPRMRQMTHTRHPDTHGACKIPSIGVTCSAAL